MVVATKPDKARPPSGLEVGHLLIAVHSRVRRLVDDAMTDSGVSLSRTKVLMLLSARGPINQAAIATEFGFAPRSITDLVDALERDGFAERLDDPADRRSRLVRITESGATALQSAMKIKTELFEEIFSALDPSARAQLAAHLQTVHSALDPHPGDPLAQ